MNEFNRIIALILPPNLRVQTERMVRPDMKVMMEMGHSSILKEAVRAYRKVGAFVHYEEDQPRPPKNIEEILDYIRVARKCGVYQL